MLAEFFGAWKVVLILAVVLILFGASHLPLLARGLGEAWFQFRKSFDQAAHDAGESLGGIYGKPAAEALTPDNQTAELYDPDVFQSEERTRRATMRMRFFGLLRLWQSIWRSVLQHVKAKK